MLERDGDREGRKAVHEVGRAVERIDDPHELVATAAPAFFPENAMILVRATDRIDDLLLGMAIDIGDEVVASLARDLDGLEPRQAAHDEVAGLARGAH